jgi:hypothetical protein
MSNIIQERYNPVPLGVAATYTLPQGSPTGVAGFLCVTAGTITITRADGVVVVNAFPMTAGTYVPLPFYVGSGSIIALGAGASGTLGVS